MLALTETGNSNPFSFQSSVGDILQRLGSALSIERQTKRMVEHQTEELKGMCNDFDRLTALLSEMSSKDLERTRKLLVGSTQLFELAEDFMSSHIADRTDKGDKTKLLQAHKEQYVVLVEIIDRIDDLLLSIDLATDEELPAILEKFESGDMSEFISR